MLISVGRLELERQDLGGVEKLFTEKAATGPADVHDTDGEFLILRRVYLQRVPAPAGNPDVIAALSAPLGHGNVRPFAQFDPLLDGGIAKKPLDEIASLGEFFAAQAGKKVPRTPHVVGHLIAGSL
jgi:hypothetical protein